MSGMSNAAQCPVCERPVSHVESETMGREQGAYVYRVMPCGHEVDKAAARVMLEAIRGAQP